MGSEVNRDQLLVLRAQADPSVLPLALDSSPLAAMLEARLTQVADDTVRMSFHPDERFTQSTGALQGGALVAMLDFAMACAALASIGAGESVATATLSTSFLRAAQPGPLVGIGTVVRRGRSMVFVEAELKDAGGRLLATATAAMATRGRSANAAAAAAA